MLGSPAAAAPSLAPRPARPLLEVKNPAGDYPVWSSNYRALKNKKNAVRHQAREEGGGAWAAPATQAAVSAMLRSWSAAPAPGGAGGGMACCRRPWARQGGPDPAPPPILPPCSMTPSSASLWTPMTAPSWCTPTTSAPSSSWTSVL